MPTAGRPGGRRRIAGERGRGTEPSAREGGSSRGGDDPATPTRPATTSRTKGGPAAAPSSAGASAPAAPKKPATRAGEGPATSASAPAKGATSAAARTVAKPTKAERREAVRKRSQLVRVGWVVLVLLVAAAVGLAVTSVVLDRRGAVLDAARADGDAAAVTAAETVLSYDYRTLDEDFAASQPLITGDFADEYAQTSTDVVRDLATQTEAVVTAEVVSSGVVSATPEQVVVLVFVDQTTTSNRLDQPQTDQNRVRMTMSLVDGEWLVSAVDAL